MSALKTILACALATLLFACASPPPATSGRVMQGGPADAPTLEMAMETPSTCAFWLRNPFSFFASSEGRRCVAAESSLPYMFEATVEMLGDVQIFARSMALCEKTRENSKKNNVVKNMSECKKR